MRTTSIYAQIIAALMLTQICLAQQIEQPNVIGDDDTAIQTNTPSSDSGSVPASSGTNESWRIVNQNGTWWYYHANGNWSSWDGTRWNLYQLAPTVWKLTPSILDDRIHGYVTLVGVPVPAPWLAPQ